MRIHNFLLRKQTGSCTHTFCSSHWPGLSHRGIFPSMRDVGKCHVQLIVGVNKSLVLTSSLSYEFVEQRFNTFHLTPMTIP